MRRIPLTARPSAFIGALACALLILMSSTAPSSIAFAQGKTITGLVTDASDGQPLIGASVRLVESANIVGGSATDVDGRYRITGVLEGRYVFRVSFVGYTEFEQVVTIGGGDTRTIDVSLEQGISLSTVVVTAGRTAEKVLDAPASISVLGAEEIQADASLTSSAALRNTTGVDMSQTGIDRREIVLRGFNNAFSGQTYVLTDYRQGAAPSLGVNIYSIMPNIGVDLDRVEVVRGPGSALYGAGVDAGVVHFLTKSPFVDQGGALSIVGGERSLFGVDGRFAAAVNDKVAFKLTGTYGQADDWGYSVDDPLDAAQLAADRLYATASDAPDNQIVCGRDVTVDSSSDCDAAGKLLRTSDYEKLNVNGTAQFVVNDKTTVTASAGLSRYSGTVLSGIGTVQADGFGYSYGQLRLQSGGLFAQAYVNANDAGDSYVYGSGIAVVDKSMQINGQVQYDAPLAGGRHQVIVGGDIEVIKPDTEETIYGRFESDDQITEFGAYTQGRFSLSPEVDATLALRGDYNDVVDQFQVSPRVALVYKPMSGHSLRASYNRAFSSPGNNSLFLDIVAAAVGPVTIRGLGSNKGWTWQRNESFGLIPGSETDLQATSLNPSTLGFPTPAGLPLDAVYGSIYGSLAAIPTAQLVAILAQNGILVDEPTAAALVGLLSPTATNVVGFSAGDLAHLNTTTQSFDLILGGDVSDIAALGQTTTNIFEVGYKGVINNKVLVAVDGYYALKKNFVGPLRTESPWVLASDDFAAELTAAIQAGIEGNTPLNSLLPGLGLNAAAVAGIITALAAPDLPAAGSPIAIVEAVENAVAPGNAPEAFLSYRNFGDVDYGGVDASIQVLATDELTIFGNVSVVSDDFFTAEELGEDDEGLNVALNATKFKAKFGGRYTKRAGLSVSASGRYTDGFPVASGPYVGDVPNYFLLDLGAGYDLEEFAPGLRVDLAVQNVLDEGHREFIGAPELGRLFMGRLTYTFRK